MAAAPGRPGALSPRARRARRERPRTLLLLRHAKSSRDDPALADLDRPLTRRGHRAARKLAQRLSDRAGGPPGLVLCSPARRTLETLEPLSRRLPVDAAVLVERGLYLAGAERLLRRLRRLPDAARDVLVVGHDPGLHELALALARPGRSRDLARLREKHPTGALVVLALDLSCWRDLEPGTGRLVEYTIPRDLD
jgi:phosphohistidine phosphatase